MCLISNHSWLLSGQTFWNNKISYAMDAGSADFVSSMKCCVSEARLYRKMLGSREINFPSSQNVNDESSNWEAKSSMKNLANFGVPKTLDLTRVT